MEIYVVQVNGSHYDENYNEVEYVGTSKKTALKLIENSKGRTMTSGYPLYAYFQTWENEIKTSEKEFEL
jgi:hypothetical protein